MPRMAVWKRARMAQGIALLTVLALLLVAAVRVAASARWPRADFTFNNSSEITTLDPAGVTGIPEGRILRAISEGLVALDLGTLEPVPAAAESWELSPDGRSYTFHLRSNGRWSNGDPLTAEDFQWSLLRVLDPKTACANAYQLGCIEGAREYMAGLDERGQPLERDLRRVAIRAKDPLTLRIRLAQPTPYFLALLALPSFAPVHRASLERIQASSPLRWQSEWVRPENLVTNGPFRVAERRINDRIRLVKSPTYWDSDHVALRTIDALAVEHWGTALNLYLTGQCDWLDGSIPTASVPRLEGREDFRCTPYLGCYFYRFNTTRPPFDDPRVRRALAMSVNRVAICQRVLKAGQEPLLTLIPWGRLGDYESPATGLDPAGVPPVARRLLVQAGYGPKGKPFPTIAIHFNTGEVHRDIAEVIAANWKSTLGIDVRLRNQEWKVYLDTQARLDYDLSRGSWIGDYPDPQSFLEVFTSRSANNRTGWSNAEYDSLLAGAALARTPKERFALLQQAEKLLIEEQPILPLYSYVTQNLVDPRLGGFQDNPLNEISPKAWYWMDDAELARRRADAASDKKRAVDAPGPRDGLRAPADPRARPPGRAGDRSR
jgi:oligopeptide transport system substrate-binding protein